MQQLLILLLINCSSTCFGRLYAHHQEVTLPMVFCPVVTVVMLESRLASCVHCVEWVATGQKTIGSETQCDLLMMGVKTPETC